MESDDEGGEIVETTVICSSVGGSITDLKEGKRERELSLGKKENEREEQRRGRGGEVEPRRTGSFD